MRNSYSARKNLQRERNKRLHMRAICNGGFLLFALLILLTTSACDKFFRPAGNPPLAADLKEFLPFPQLSGDKGQDAVNMAAALVDERQRRKAVVELYCANAKPC